jgi:hypothetical protein
MGRWEGGSPLFDTLRHACHSDNAVVVSSYYWAAFRPARPGEARTCGVLRGSSRGVINLRVLKREL